MAWMQLFSKLNRGINNDDVERRWLKIVGQSEKRSDTETEWEWQNGQSGWEDLIMGKNY